MLRGQAPHFITATVTAADNVDPNAGQQLDFLQRLSRLSSRLDESGSDGDE